MREMTSAKTIKRPRDRYYGKEVEEALLVAWAATNYIASKRLAPFQRLRDSGVIDTKTLEKLNYVNHTLDPVRLLKQIEALQDTLWQHAV